MMICEGTESSNHSMRRAGWSQTEIRIYEAVNSLPREHRNTNPSRRRHRSSPNRNGRIWKWKFVIEGPLKHKSWLVAVPDESKSKWERLDMKSCYRETAEAQILAGGGARWIQIEMRASGHEKLLSGDRWSPNPGWWRRQMSPNRNERIWTWKVAI